ncbi:TlpA disulfide reductase family protein [Paenibacillus sp. PL2-23]|uniref:TlpA disulfide reductase family protein n=1 Tax=Paenibacillus sp. PL2-23 TaxID=2100729 RepID=UPI0030F9B517
MKLLYAVSAILVVAWLGVTAGVVMQFSAEREERLARAAASMDNQASARQEGLEKGSERMAEEPEELQFVKTEEYGKRMIDFTLEDQHGQSLTVSASSGKPKLINFWTSWCPGCKSEADDLNRIYEKYKDELEIVSVNITENDSMEEALAFMEDYQLQLPVLFDLDSVVSGDYSIIAIPTNYFIRADGTIQTVTYELSEQNAEPFLQELLESGQ